MNKKSKYRGSYNVHPVIYEKTRDGEVLYDVYSRLMKERILFLTEEINADVASTLSATMFYLDSKNSEKEIKLYINCPGGSVDDGLFTIYDTMQYIKAPVVTICIGSASSAAAVVLAAGQKRMAFENSRIMIHEVSSGVEGTVSDMDLFVKETNRINEITANMLSTHTGQPIDVIKKDIKKDKYFSAKEALAYGLIDEIVQYQKILPSSLARNNVEKLPKKVVRKIRGSKKNIKKTK